MEVAKWDVIISYDIGDAEAVESLVRELERLGLRVWWDKKIAPGQSLRREIDKAILSSQVGIPFVGRRYLEKEWPNDELDALLERRRQGRITVIPVRHGLTHAELSGRSPLLSGPRSLSTDVGIPSLAEEIVYSVHLNWLHLATMEVAMPSTPQSESAIPPDRLRELRLSVIEELNELTANYITNYIADSEFRPDLGFHQRLLVVTDRIRNLFSEAAFNAFKRVEVMIGPGLGPVAQGAVHRFIEARIEALAALYREAGITRDG